MNNRDFLVNIEVYTFCYNDSFIIPEVIKYWEKYASHVIVYDNHSTDNSVELFSKYDWIEVREYDSNNKYDPELIQKMKETIYKGSKADYVMVCDIDEVILYKDSLMNFIEQQYLTSADVFCSQYYNLLSLTNNLIKSEILIQNNSKMKCIFEKNIKKAILFKPNIKLTLRFYGQEYTTNKVCKTSSIPILHLKMIDTQYLKDRQTLLSNRLEDSANKDIALYYGKDSQSAESLYKQYEFNIRQFAYNLMIKNKAMNAVDIKYNCEMLSMQNVNGYHKIKWINYNREDNSQIENKDCVIVIPVYKAIDKLKDDEILSIKQGIKILENNYHICLVGPATLNYDDYNKLFNFKFDILKCNNEFFKNLSTYSYLCESYEFYKAFEDYQYMLIYQPDGWIFENRLNDFIKLDYDYIGSPWKAGEFGSKEESVGNGGVSLRKNKVFIDICKNLVEKDFNAKWVGLEDLFFCKYVYKNIKKFNIAPANIARQFCISCYPSYFTQSGKNIPMCAHAWHKEYDDKKFWKTYIH